MVNLTEHRTSSPQIEQPPRRDKVTVTREFFRDQISCSREKASALEGKAVHRFEEDQNRGKAPVVSRGSVTTVLLGGADDIPCIRDTVTEVPSCTSTDTIQSSLECITLSPPATNEPRVFEPVDNTFTISDDESLTSLHDSLESSLSLTPLQSPITRAQATKHELDITSGKQTTEQAKPKIVGILKKPSLIQAASDISITSIANSDSLSSKQSKKVRFKDNETSSEDSSSRGSGRYHSAVTPQIKISLTHPSRHQNGVIPRIVSVPSKLDSTPTDEDIDTLWAQIKGYFPHKHRSLISLPPSNYVTSHQHHIDNHTRARRPPSTTRSPPRRHLPSPDTSSAILSRPTGKGITIKLTSKILSLPCHCV